MILAEYKKAGSWRKLSSIIPGCRPENLAEAGGGGHIPIAAAEFFGLERIEVRTVVYRRKSK